MIEKQTQTSSKTMDSILDWINKPKVEKEIPVDNDKIWTSEEVTKEYDNMNKTNDIVKKSDLEKNNLIPPVLGKNSNEVLDMIKECYKMCNFIINHNWLRKRYELESEKDEDVMIKKDLYTIFEFYGINKWEEKEVENFYKYEFTRKDIDIIEKYLQVKWINYDEDKFQIVKIKRWAK